MAGIISDIATASAEQATGIEQVNKALTQMDEVTQQNSALVEENAATAKTLEQQSKAMNDEVSVFRVDDSDDEAAAAPARSAAAARKPEVKPAAKPAVAQKRAVTVVATVSARPERPQTRPLVGRMHSDRHGGERSGVGKEFRMPALRPDGAAEAASTACRRSPLARVCILGSRLSGALTQFAYEHAGIALSESKRNLFIAGCRAGCARSGCRRFATIAII